MTEPQLLGFLMGQGALGGGVPWPLVNQTSSPEPLPGTTTRQFLPSSHKGCGFV